MVRMAGAGAPRATCGVSATVVMELPLRRAVAPLSEGGCERDLERFKLLFSKANWRGERMSTEELLQPLAL